MAKQDQFIRLLLVEDSAEDAEQVVSQLRNGGMAVRPVRAESRDHLTDQLVNQPVDIVLVNLKSKLMPIADVTRLATQAGKDRTVVAITPMINDDVALALQRAGVFAFALRSHPDHLQAVVRHEFEALSARRALRRIDVSLKETERRAEALLDSSRDPIAFVHEGMHVRANKAYLDMFGFDDFEEIEGISILDMIAPEAAGGFKDLLKKLSKGEKPPSKLEVKAQKSDGSPFDAVMEFAEATFEGEPCQQITLRPQRSGVDAAQLDELRSKDLVTGLFNRTHALAELDRVVAEAANGSSDAALLMLEPDNYRGVADNIGLGSMDLLYSDLAQHLRQHARETDLAARFSDTVLLLLLRGTTHDEAQKRAQALRKSFEDKIFEAGSKSLPVPVSIGMVLIGERIANADAILGNASSNLKAAQAAGGNKVKVFDPAAQDKADAAAEKLRVEQLQDALRKNGFVLFYQPIISLHGAEGEFYEILLRMLGANGEQLMPAEFFPIAEKHGLLAQLDRWVVANAIKALAEREKAGHKTTFFVKITVPSLEDPSMLPWIAQHLKTNRVSGDKLSFEMPESKVTTNLKPVREFMRGLGQLHCNFAVQQFGSGLNSFQLLKHVDAKYLKIDRTFMADFAKNKENQAKVKEICDQAHAHGKLTIAEFVEDAASMSILFTLGVNFVQGNFLQEPEKVMSYDFG